MALELSPTRAEYTPGVLSALALVFCVYPVLKALSNGWESVFLLVLVAALGLILVDVASAMQSVGSRARVQLSAHSLRVFEAGKVSEFVFEQLRSVQFEEKRHTRNGSQIGLHRRLTLEGPQDSSTLENLTLMGERDLFGQFVEAVLELAASAAQRRIAAGHSLRGEGWQLDAQALKTPKLTVARSSLTTAALREDGVGVWRKGEEAPVLLVPLAGRNARVLLGVVAPADRAATVPQKGPGPQIASRSSDFSASLACLLVTGVSLGLDWLFYVNFTPPMPDAGAASIFAGVVTLVLAWFVRPLVLSVHQRAVKLHRWPSRPHLTLRDEEVVQVGIGFTPQYAQEEIYVSTVTELTLTAANGKRLVFKTNRRQPDEVLRAVHDRLLPRLTAWMHGRLDAGHKIPWAGIAALERDGLRTLQDPHPIPYAQLTLRLEEEEAHVGTTTGRRLFCAKLSELNAHACLRVIEERIRR